jgi:hypothetical protein
MADAFRVLRDFAGQNFERDEAFELRVLSQKDFAHSARPKRGTYLITTEKRTGTKWHGCNDRLSRSNNGETLL